MIRRPPRSTRTDTLFPYTTLFRSPSRCLWYSPTMAGSLKTASRHCASLPICLPPCLRQRTADWMPCRSEEHTSELQSLMRISYAVFCLKKKKSHIHTDRTHPYLPTTVNTDTNNIGRELIRH